MVIGMNSTTSSTKPMKFRSRKAAEKAVDECFAAGWPCFVLGTQAPFIVQSRRTNNGVQYTYDLHTNGHFVEYSRKEVAA
jgi:hypothetical protein